MCNPPAVSIKENKNNIDALRKMRSMLNPKKRNNYHEGADDGIDRLIFHSVLITADKYFYINKNSESCDVETCGWRIADNDDAKRKSDYLFINYSKPLYHDVLDYSCFLWGSILLESITFHANKLNTYVYENERFIGFVTEELDKSEDDIPSALLGYERIISSSDRISFRNWIGIPRLTHAHVDLFDENGIYEKFYIFRTGWPVSVLIKYLLKHPIEEKWFNYVLPRKCILNNINKENKLLLFTTIFLIKAKYIGYETFDIGG